MQSDAKLKTCPERKQASEFTVFQIACARHVSSKFALASLLPLSAHRRQPLGHQRSIAVKSGWFLRSPMDAQHEHCQSPSGDCKGSQGFFQISNVTRMVSIQPLVFLRKVRVVVQQRIEFSDQAGLSSKAINSLCRRSCRRVRPSSSCHQHLSEELSFNETRQEKNSHFH